MQSNQSNRLVLAAVGVGLLLRLILAAISIGSNDATNWLYFARFLQSDPICNLFADTTMANNPPLITVWGRFALQIAASIGLPILFVFKLPGIACEGLICWILLRLPVQGGRLSKYTPALYALSLISILVSGYHGNTDPICIGLLFSSVVLLDTKDRPFWSGVLFALSLNVKVIGLCLAPCFLARALYLKNGRRFVAGGAVGILTFVPILLECPALFYRNVLQYNSIQDEWGFRLIAEMVITAFPSVGPVAAACVGSLQRYGKFLVIALVALMTVCAQWRWRSNLFVTSTLAWVIFLIFAPGFGIQYLAYPVPFLLVTNAFLGTVYCLLSGIFALALYSYYLRDSWPLTSMISHGIPGDLFPLSCLVWAACVYVAVKITNQQRLQRGRTLVGE